MGNSEASWSTNITSTIIVAGLGALAAAVLLAGLAVAPQPATALPTYAEKERKDCRYCHVNPAGGSVLNGNGRAYQANGYTFKK
jgi:hypothetical protein